MHHLKNSFGLALCGLLLSSAGHAAPGVSGQIHSSLTVVPACEVNGTTASSNLDFGSLNFGATSALMQPAGTQVLKPDGGAMSIRCAAGFVPVLKLRAGRNDGQASTGSRALHDGAGHYVGYDLYTDAGFNNLLPIEGIINLAVSNGTAQTLNLYGKVTAAAGLPPGTYTDSIAVELSF